MKALILAAGYATRLYPITKEYPKPLLKVGDKPIIDYIMEKLNSIRDLDEIIVVTNSKFISQFRIWKAKNPRPKRVTLVDDQTHDQSDRRGAIGDMHFVIEKKHIADDLLVIGGDNLFDSDLDEFVSFAKAKKTHPVIGAYHIKDRRQASKYGVIRLDEEKKVIDFKEKPKQPKSNLVAMCLYYFPRERSGMIKEYLSDKTHKYDATGSYIDWLRKKCAVYGFVFGGRWFDIGDYKFYHEAGKKFM